MVKIRISYATQEELTKLTLAIMPCAKIMKVRTTDSGPYKKAYIDAEILPKTAIMFDDRKNDAWKDKNDI